MSGWIKIHRTLEDWEWASIPEMVSLWIYLLINASHKDKKWKGIEVKRGQVIFGRDTWSKKTGIPPQSLRTCIERLKSTSEITSQSTNRFTIITIVKYEEYQVDCYEPTSQSTSKLTNNQPATNQQLTTSKKRKKERSNIYAPLFDEFWKLYPRKVDKASALKAYAKAIDGGAEPSSILEAIRAQMDSFGSDTKFIPHAATWLNKKRYEDEVEKTVSYGKMPSPAGG